MTTTKHRKKLIEVSIPLEAINRESAREKSIRHGHPSTLHLWWARRPLAACRAVLFAQLVDDPGSCQEEFPTVEQQKAERDRLHRLIERLVPWESSTNEMVLNEARYEIARSVARGRGETLRPLKQMKPQEIVDYLQANAPPVYDPFSGGGSIPLEAQRLGLRAMGSDLNPVAVLIGKALVEFPPKFADRKPVNPEADELRHYKGAQGLAEDVRYFGRWMREQAIRKIGHLYPKVKLKDGSDATVIAWLWARTVASPDPKAKGAHVPLASSFVLSAKEDKQVIVAPAVERAKMTWAFDVKEKPSAAEIEAAKKGTKAARGANFVCLLTGSAIDDKHVKGEAKAGRMGAALMAIVVDGQRGRMYLAPRPDHAKAATVKPPDVPEIDQPMPENPRWFSPPDYGMPNYKDLFTPRQLMALTTFSDLVMKAREKVLADAQAHWSGDHADDTAPLADGGLGPTAYADAVATYIGISISKMADAQSSLVRWKPTADQAIGTFGRQALPMLWDYAESNPFAGMAGDPSVSLRNMMRVVGEVPCIVAGGIEVKDAQANDFGEMVFATDPPYYDNIGYADLSDYFYVWLRRTLRDVHPDLFRRVLTPKADELVATPYRHGGKDQAEGFFLDGMKKALAGLANATVDAPVTIFYAYKQKESEGWTTFLQAVLDSGLAVDATWPVRTELSNRMIASGTNALDSSIVHVCRRREPTAATITRADFLRALRRELPEALAEIRRVGVGPTDIQQAAIGPGMGIFTRHAQVLNTDGTPMLVKDALKLINQVREEVSSDHDADYDSETRFALDWFAAHEFKKGKAGVAIGMTNAVNISLDRVRGAGFFKADDGVARLMERKDLPAAWDPAKDNRATVWEACQHLIKRLTAEDGGIDEAARLYNRLGRLAEPAHALARRLYDICEQKQWAAEGHFYNQLYQEWAAIEKRAAELANTDLFDR